MDFTDYDKLFFPGSIITHSSPSAPINEMHCCENCKQYSSNDRASKGCTDDSEDNNECGRFAADWVLKCGTGARVITGRPNKELSL